MTKPTVAFRNFANAFKKRPASDTAVTTARGVSTFTCLSLSEINEHIRGLKRREQLQSQFI